MRYLILGIIIILILIIAVRTVKFKPRKYEVESADEVDIDIKKAAENLSGSIRIKTISNSDSKMTDWNEFRKFHMYLESTYPQVHSILEKEVVNDYSLIYKWKGKNNNKKPILLTAHMDVVPVEKATESDWSFEPFNGDIENGYVWGRGTLDIKIQIIGIMEAVSTLLKNDYIPEQDIYFAFGHDEEVGGHEGAVNIAELFKSRGIEFDYVLDEGGCVTEGFLKDIESPLAVIGVAEKGYANIRLTAKGNGGHASMPPKSTAVGSISRAVVKLEEHQLKKKLTEPVKNLLYYIGPEMSLVNRIIIANLWLFKPLFIKAFSSMNSGNALLRTTTAATMAQGSLEPNILPQKASTVFNFRILPGETGNQLLEHIKKTINDENIKIETLRLDEPSKVSSIDTSGFKIIEKTVYQIFPEAIVSPYLGLAGTDARKYENVCDNIYRFSPYQIKSEDLSKMHGTNECISLKNIEKCIKFYVQLIKNS